jgi:hypothetical protein
VFGHFQHEVVYEARVRSGHGARWAQGGAEFIGFLEPFLGGEKARRPLSKLSLFP